MEATNNTYLNLEFAFGVRDQRSLTLEPSEGSDYAVVSDFGNFTVRLTLDWGIVLDGRPAIFVYNMTDEPLRLAGASSNWFGYRTRLAFCSPSADDSGDSSGPLHPLGRWSSFYYDPSLQVLFGDATRVGPSDKARPKWLLPVAITIPVVVAIVVITVVLLVIFVPAVRATLLPHNKETRGRRSMKDRPGSPQQWRRSKTPVA